MSELREALREILSDMAVCRAMPSRMLRQAADALDSPGEAAELREALRPRLSKLARQRLEETAEAEEGCGDADVADAIRFLLEREDKIGALLKNEGE